MGRSIQCNKALSRSLSYNITNTYLGAKVDKVTLKQVHEKNYPCKIINKTFAFSSFHIQRTEKFSFILKFTMFQLPKNHQAL